jgi:hypothetical protein
MSNGGERSTGAEFSATAPNYLGDVQSNFVGTEWAVRGHVMCQADEREDLGVVLYDTNVLGSKGPRCMRAFIPQVDEVEYTPEEQEPEVEESKVEESKLEDGEDVEDSETKGKGKGKCAEKEEEGGKKPRIISKRRAWVPTKANGEDGMLLKVRETVKEETSEGEKHQGERDIKGMSCYINKPPRWNDHVGAYVLNFHGRVTKASVKNFQLVTHENAAGLEEIALMFGRRDANEFAMDYRWPMSAFQAFAIAITSCNSKLACE